MTRASITHGGEGVGAVALVERVAGLDRIHASVPLLFHHACLEAAAPGALALHEGALVVIAYSEEESALLFGSHLVQLFSGVSTSCG